MDLRSRHADARRDPDRIESPAAETAGVGFEPWSSYLVLPLSRCQCRVMLNVAPVFESHRPADPGHRSGPGGGKPLGIFSATWWRHGWGWLAKPAAYDCASCSVPGRGRNRVHHVAVHRRPRIRRQPTSRRQKSAIFWPLSSRLAGSLIVGAQPRSRVSDVAGSRADLVPPRQGDEPRGIKLRSSAQATRNFEPVQIRRSTGHPPVWPPPRPVRTKGRRTLKVLP